MNECWYALALALLSTEYYTPEIAFKILDEGVKHKRKLRPTDKDTLDMIEMYKTIDGTKIAAIYGIDRSTVCRRIAKGMNKTLTNKKLSHVEIAEMIKLKESMTYKQVGRIYDMSADAVYRRIKRFNEAI